MANIDQENDVNYEEIGGEDGTESPETTKVETEVEAENDDDTVESPDDDTEVETENGDEESDDETSQVEEDGTAEAEEAVRTTRGRNRHAKLASQLKAEREERERLIRENAEQKARLDYIEQRRSAEESDAERKAEEERLALLDPTERAVYQANKRAQELERRFNLMQMQMQDSTDRANFLAKAEHNELYKSTAEEVEQMYQEGLRRGVVAPREDLHSLILGRRLKADMSAKLSKKKAEAGKRVAATKSKPVQGKGDVAGAKKGKSEEDRLRGVLI